MVLAFGSAGLAKAEVHFSNGLAGFTVRTPPYSSRSSGIRDHTARIIAPIFTCWTAKSGWRA